MKVEHFAEALAPLLKDLGFKKQRFNWRKDLDESIAVLNVQISSWGDRSYYVNVGIYLKALGEEVSPPHNRCHVQGRLSVETPEAVAAAAQAWFAARSNLQALAALHRVGGLQGNGLVFKEVVSAVSSLPAT
jgi:hypothetical protein